MNVNPDVLGKIKQYVLFTKKEEIFRNNKNTFSLKIQLHVPLTYKIIFYVR